SDFKPRAKRVIHFSRAEQMKGHFLTPCAIHIENGRTGKARVFFKQTKGLSVFVKSSEETSVLSPREADHAQFRDHNRPTENRYELAARERPDQFGIGLAEIFDHNSKDRVTN